MYSLYIFDFDGTLADTKECVVAAFQSSLKIANLSPVPREEIIYLMGRSLKEVYKNIIGDTYPDDFYENLITSYRKAYPQFLATKTALFDNIDSTLYALKNRGALCSIATSKNTDQVKLNAKYLGIEKYFDLVVGDDAVTLKKPHPEMIFLTLEHLHITNKARVLVIGDSTFDIDMGNTAGVDTCAVTWGAHSQEELLQSNPTWLVHTPVKLLSLSEPVQ